MLVKDDVMPLLLAACPSFRAAWEAYRAEPTYEADLLYVDLGELAHHLVELMRRGATDEFPAVFDGVERLHVEGDDFVKEAATIGLLEGIQNVAGNSGVEPARFVPYLKPESARWWAELEAFWDGKAAHVGARLKP